MNEWILIVDDDVNNLRAASHILVAEQMRVSCVKSGEEAIRFLEGSENLPNLILLDILMPGMDGFETLSHIKNNPALSSIPVAFLTAEDDAQTEVRGLQCGALDFIKKPFVPEVLMARVRLILEYTMLRNNLTQQVEEKTQAVLHQQKQISDLSLHLVETLAETIDAKDSYTNGHSTRVAELAKEIGRRYGYSENQQSVIYVMGLLHDIGKIGVPDEVIRKPGKLTPEEYKVIKTHPMMGYRILSKISEMPMLAVAARCHHERVDGSGYPDGLSGTDILEEARIIAVADAYDAMTRARIYRDALPLEKVKDEIKRGKETQFDPVFADILLQMIEEKERCEHQ